MKRLIVQAGTERKDETEHLLIELLQHVLFYVHFAGSRSPEKVKAARLVELWHWGCAQREGMQVATEEATEDQQQEELKAAAANNNNNNGGGGLLRRGC